jgi:hypothetical protein
MSRSVWVEAAAGLKWADPDPVPNLISEQQPNAVTCYGLSTAEGYRVETQSKSHGLRATGQTAGSSATSVRSGVSVPFRRLIPRMLVSVSPMHGTERNYRSAHPGRRTARQLRSIRHGHCVAL